jgi:hypothetical protein
VIREETINPQEGTPDAGGRVGGEFTWTRFWLFDCELFAAELLGEDHCCCVCACGRGVGFGVGLWLYVCVCVWVYVYERREQGV